MKDPVAVFWFRRDLRLHDNAGLFHALKSGLPVLPVFIFDRQILNKLENKADPRVQYIHQSLTKMQDQLHALGSDLMTWYDDPMEAWKSILIKYRVMAVYTNEDYEPGARVRDKSISDLLDAKGIPFYPFKDQVIFNPSEILKDNGLPYTIFTPYKNRWRNVFSQTSMPVYDTGKHLYAFARIPFHEIHSLQQLGFKPSPITVPAPLTNLMFLESYRHDRDFPALAGTSHLSIHFRFGTVSIREWVQLAFSRSETWINELIWREFYMMILWHFPYAVSGAFKPAYNHIRWRNNEVEFEKWCMGNTGYPVVDAGMRELNATGFMHNRLRMITAGFLTKHLLVDWRWGEAYFASRLLDFELSSNNGGWQWAAGTGCDAAPYFRIFNPYEQTRKFDPELRYIRHWIPELNSGLYPEPVVDHVTARHRCLAVYKESLAIKYN